MNWGQRVSTQFAAAGWIVQLEATADLFGSIAFQ
jgi:hypothetical protein